MKGMSKRVLTALAIAGYILGAALTYGYAYEQTFTFRNGRWPAYEASNQSDAVMEGMFCSWIWPLYWPYHASRIWWAR